MLLGKRPRAPIMKRTTSMTEITLDLNTSTTDSRPSDPHNLFDARQKPAVTGALSGQHSHGAGHNWLDQRFSPRTNRRHSADFLETPNFLRACSLCKRRLVPGRDIYMYRYSLSPRHLIFFNSSWLTCQIFLELYISPSFRSFSTEMFLYRTSFPVTNGGNKLF